MENVYLPTVLGKRKGIEHDETLMLHLSPRLGPSPLLPGHAGSQTSSQQTPKKKNSPMIVNGTLVENTKKRYCCTFEGCEKAYTKPSRLEEHERSHTGQRPFICETCGNSYLRETHLHAHTRCHLPESSRPFVCERKNCEKRFWTSQHLKTHYSWHDGAKPYTCNEDGCGRAFSKHSLLRIHICTEHAPAGTKPYCCEHEGCSKSFDTNQHLRTHQKIHDRKRYTCVHMSCLANAEDSPPYFPTWSALQTHMRKTHPPKCPHPSCNGRTFANQGNLRAHLKIHEHREIDNGIYLEHDSENESDLLSKKKRRGGEYGRDWKCDVRDCGKDFKSKKALDTHIRVTHLGKRDFVCDYPDCSYTFGYKHLLQRHQVKIHQSGPSVLSSHDEDSSDSESRNHKATFDIDMITGNTYAKRAEANIKSAKVLRCPFPFLQDIEDVINPLDASASTSVHCDYVFTRGYDARRHLKASHNVIVMKDAMDNWVRRRKQEG